MAGLKGGQDRIVATVEKTRGSPSEGELRG